MRRLLDKYREEDSIFAISFFAHNLSNTKKTELKRIAKIILDCRNELSEIVQNDLIKFLNMSKFDFVNYFNPMFSARLSGHFIKMMMEDVYDSYQKRSDAINKKIKFELVTDIKIEFYKRNTKYNKKGDLKSITKKTKSTSLSIALTYLARYGNDSTIEYITKSLSDPEIKDDKKRLYENILRVIEKFGFERIMKLALSKRSQIFSTYDDRDPIIFTSLTFRGRSRIGRPIVDKRRKNDKKSKNTHFVELSWVWANPKGKRKKHSTMIIPVKYNKGYHRNLKRYCNGTDTSYTITFKHKTIQIILTRDGKRYIPINEIEQEKVVGADVNQKHNMIILSDGFQIQHNNEITDELEKQLLIVDKKKEVFDKKQKAEIELAKAKAKAEGSEYIKPKKVGYRITKRDTKLLEAIGRRNHHDQETKISDLMKYMNKMGLNHIVLEDLDGFSGAKTYGDTEGGVNTGRMGHALNLSSIKDIVLHMAPHYGISVSLVHKEFTSQTCSHCSCVDKENRQSQESFVCISCGHADNADRNAAINIKIRLISTVLREKLLTQRNTGYSAFLPKNLPRWKVKEALEKCRHGKDIDPFGNFIEQTEVSDDHCELLLRL